MKMGVHMDYECELRIRLTKEMTKQLKDLKKKMGMDLTNITRVALIEYINNHGKKVELW